MDHDCIYSRGLPGLPQMSVAPKRFRALPQHSVKCLKRRQQMEPNPWWHNLTCCGCCTMLYTLGASWYLIQILTWLRYIQIHQNDTYLTLRVPVPPTFQALPRGEKCSGSQRFPRPQGLEAAFEMTILSCAVHFRTLTPKQIDQLLRTGIQKEFHINKC